MEDILDHFERERPRHRTEEHKFEKPTRIFVENKYLPDVTALLEKNEIKYEIEKIMFSNGIHLSMIPANQLGNMVTFIHFDLSDQSAVEKIMDDYIESQETKDENGEIMGRYKPSPISSNSMFLSFSKAFIFLAFLIFGVYLLLFIIAFFFSL